MGLNPIFKAKKRQLGWESRGGFNRGPWLWKCEYCQRIVHGYRTRKEAKDGYWMHCKDKHKYQAKNWIKIGPGSV